MNHKISIYFQHCFKVLISPILLLALCACTTSSEPTTIVPATILAPNAKTPANALSAEADNALKTAEQNVVEARIQRALWIAAVEELDKARAAAKALDSEGTLKHAREVILLCALSLQQKQVPPVAW